MWREGWRDQLFTVFFCLKVYWESKECRFNTFKKIRSSAKGQQFIIFITTIIATIDLCVCLRTKAANTIGKEALRIAKYTIPGLTQEVFRLKLIKR